MPQSGLCPLSLSQPTNWRAFGPSTFSIMGTLTLTELKTEITSALGNRDDLDSRLTAAINLSQTRIARTWLWTELRSSVDDNFTVTGTLSTDKIYALPAATRDVLSIRVVDSSLRSRKLSRLTYNRFDKMIPEPERYTTGLPSIYMKYKNNIELWKIPDDTYQILIRLILWPTALSSSGDTSDLEHKDDMIIALTVSYLSNSLGKEERARFWWRIYQRMLAEAKSAEQDEPDLDIRRSEEIGITGPDYWKDPFVSGPW